MFPEMNRQVMTMTILTGANVDLVEGTDQQFIIGRMPKAAEITNVYMWSNVAINAGTVRATILDKGSAGTATGSTIAQHGTATAFAADTPVAETVSEGTLDAADFISLRLENESSGTTVTLNGFGIQIEYVQGNPAASGG